MGDENVKVVKDFGVFGEGKWQKHLTLCSWFGKEAKYDIRPWNEDMTKFGKGVTLDDGELYDLLALIENALGLEDETSDDEEDYYDDVDEE